jgi:hypothetical protein
MKANGTCNGKHEWLIDTLVDMVCYADMNGIDYVSAELVNTTLMVSQLLELPIKLEEEGVYHPPRSAVVIPFRPRVRTDNQ